ncbi:hypothetical protein D3C74_382770 [compost metagenome]
MKTNFLQVKVHLQMGQFLLQGDNLLLRSHRIFQQAAQVGDHPADMVCTGQSSHPFDGIQRVEQEMRVDLRLQSLKPRFLFALLLLG